MKVLFIADIIGTPGIEVLHKELKLLLTLENIDLVIANGENAADGFGLTPKFANEIFASGVDVITLGNHTWDKKEIIPILCDKRIIRPINYSNITTPGQGYTFAMTKKGVTVAIINALGQIFMNPIDSAFKAIDSILPTIKQKTNIIIIDFHAEATSEKSALGWYLDGRVSAVLGTHTHIATADERILDNGTAFITDVGLTGSHNSVIGMNKEKIIQKFLTQMPIKYEVANSEIFMQGVLVEINENTGKAISINRIKKGKDVWKI
ncbi:MAG: TIGR00282 family metallophosphoesterase [Elusimicrobiota bacterium]|jgi:metallophosphoesterase (TIGR00282 family)|nr:TIGR00282 family metallophosphoesterase [Elusimicrobiota bacterium]